VLSTQNKKNRYIEKDLEDTYDVIIIGAGIGGLFAANFLAFHNIKTLLVEQHNVVGGLMQGGWKKNNYFDYGTQSNEIKGGILPALKYLKLDNRISFKKCTHRLVSDDGLDLKLGNLEDAKKAFKKAYPNDSKSIEKYFEFYKKVAAIAKLENEDGMKGLIETDTSLFMPDYKKYWQNKSYYKDLLYYDSISASKKAKEILDKDSPISKVLTNLGYRNCSTLATGIFWYLWQDDYYYNVGGKQYFMDTLAHAFIERGGTLSTNTKVEKILTKNNLASGIQFSNGETIRGKYIISNSDMKATIKQLLNGNEHMKNWQDEIENNITAEAFFTVYLTLDMPIDELKKYLNDSHHVWYYPTQSKSITPFNTEFHKSLPMEISAACLHDSNLVQDDKHSTLVLQSFSFYEWMNRWKISKTGHKSKEYYYLKREVEDQLISNLEKIIPNVKNKIIFKQSATPLTHKRYTMNENGSTGGWTWNPKKTYVGFNQQKITTPINNLYFVGQWTLYQGSLLTATISGKIAADLIINKENESREPIV
jgi:phytoene dehydrogenase-like protein